MLSVLLALLANLNEKEKENFFAKFTKLQSGLYC